MKPCLYETQYTRNHFRELVFKSLVLTSYNFIFSDHDFIQEQENRLLMMCKRTMALPVGRCVTMFIFSASLQFCDGK